MRHEALMIWPQEDKELPKEGFTLLSLTAPHNWKIAAIVGANNVLLYPIGFKDNFIEIPNLIYFDL